MELTAQKVSISKDGKNWVDIGVPVLEPKSDDLTGASLDINDLIAKYRQSKPRRFAKYSPTGRKPGQAICVLCGRSGGTLMFVRSGDREGWVHLGGNCQAAVTQAAMGRIKRQMRALLGTPRLTKRGHAMRYDNEGKQSYELTSREVERRRTRRKMQKQNRRANRG